MASFTRASRSFWGDKRFFIGLLLVLASVVGVWFVVTSSRETTTMLQAERTIVRGEVVTPADFRTVEVGLGAVQSTYLTPDQLAPGSIAVRTITAGELVPHSALAASETARTTTVVIVGALGVSDSLARGTTVELWAAVPLAEGRGFEAPRLLLRSATVSSVTAGQGLLSQGGASVELVIDRAEVPAVLAALTNGSALSIIPLGPVR